METLQCLVKLSMKALNPINENIKVHGYNRKIGMPVLSLSYLEFFSNMVGAYRIVFFTKE